MKNGRLTIVHSFLPDEGVFAGVGHMIKFQVTVTFKVTVTYFGELYPLCLVQVGSYRVLPGTSFRASNLS